MFRTVPLSIIRSFSLYTQKRCHRGFADSFASRILILLASCQQTCMAYTIAVCTVKNSWWCTQELSETCRALFQKLIWEISASSLFYYKNLSRCTVTWTSNYYNCLLILLLFLSFLRVTKREFMKGNAVRWQRCLLAQVNITNLPRVVVTSPTYCVK